MTRSYLSLIAAGLLLVPVSVRAERELKVSFSPEDPNVQTTEHTTDDELTAYIFSDGISTRGGEFGLALEGADFVRYEMDTFFPWIAMPLPNPYPGTISQATGPDCVAPPVYFGKIVLKPHEPGGRVVIDVIPSLYSQSAALLDCDVEMRNGFRAYPATANPGAKPEKTHRVTGANGDSTPESEREAKAKRK